MYYYVLFALGVTIMVSLVSLFLYNRHHPIIENRGVTFSVITGVVGIVHFSVLTLELAITEDSHKDISCHFLLWSSVLYIPMFFYPIFLRSYFLFFQNRHQNEKANQNFGWYSQNKLYTSLKFNLAVYSAIILIFLIISIAVQFSSPNPDPFITTNSCISKQVVPIIIQAAIIILCTFILVVKLWDINDAFYIKLELKIALGLHFPPAIFWGFFMLAKSLFPDWFRSSWIVMVSIFAGITEVLSFPLIMTLKKRRGLKRSRTMDSTISMIEKDQFLVCLDNEILFKAFLEECKLAWCVENLLFYKTVQEFHESYPSKTVEENLARAKEIYEDFIKVESNLEVNLDDSQRELIALMLSPESIHENIFHESALTVYNMLRYGVFKEWSATKTFNLLYDQNASRTSESFSRS